MQHWPKIALRIIAILIVLFIVLYSAIALYISSNKKSLLATVTSELNNSLNGTMEVGDMEPTFFRTFPAISLTLENVVLKDSLWQKHKRTLLQAKYLDVSVNILALITGTIRVNKIGINTASVYLYTDSGGYSNTSVFKRKSVTVNKGKEESSAEVRRFTFKNVGFIMDNRQSDKLFRFLIKDLRSRVDYSFDGWEADISTNTLVKDLAFNTNKGSFLKDKELKGRFRINYVDDTGIIELLPGKTLIGGDNFTLGGSFDTSKKPAEFKITVAAENVMWNRVTAILPANISAKLNMFSFRRPISANALIGGSFAPGGKPSVDVRCNIRNNELNSPGGVVSNCNFDGFFSNHYIPGKGFTDENSVVKMYRFTGHYYDIPFTIDTAFVHNLTKPVASGTFRSRFEINSLNEVMGNDLLKFNRGTADLNLKYRADLVDFRLRKPFINGTITIKDADIDYVPRKLNFRNSSIALAFTGNDLFMNNIRVQSGKSTLSMQGKVENFMNLYYTAPEKILFNWSIKSPQINLGEFLGFLAARKNISRRPRRSKNDDFADQLNTVLEKSKVNMEIKLDKVIYDRFTATDVNASLYMSDDGINMKNISLRHAGGTIRLKGSVSHKGALNRFSIDSRVANVDVRRFFYSFNNFGLESLTHENLRGFLFSKVRMSGGITDEGKTIPRSYQGSIIFDLKKGALIGFDPIKKAGKFAFPFRDLDHITFSNLNGKFDVRGEKVIINPMMISSSVLNMNVAGIYSMGKGTNIALDVPLRNPKKDENITDKKEINERRMKGIVLHILATDGEDGKIKFKWNRNRD